MTAETLTVGEVARRWNLPNSTVRRHVKDGRMPNAAAPEGERDPWRIPLEDVVAAYGPEPDAGEAMGVELDELHQRILELEADLERAKSEAVAAQGDREVMRVQLEATRREVELKDEMVSLLREQSQLVPVLAALAGQVHGAREAIAAESEAPRKRRWWQQRGDLQR